MGEPALLVDDLRVVLGIAPPPCDDSPKGPYPQQHTTYNIQPKHNNRTSTKRKRVRRALKIFVAKNRRKVRIAVAFLKVIRTFFFP